VELIGVKIGKNFSDEEEKEDNLFEKILEDKQSLSKIVKILIRSK
jgi:hypothetical protein